MDRFSLLIKKPTHNFKAFKGRYPKLATAQPSNKYLFKGTTAALEKVVKYVQG